MLLYVYERRVANALRPRHLRSVQSERRRAARALRRHGCGVPRRGLHGSRDQQLTQRCGLRPRAGLPSRQQGILVRGVGRVAGLKRRGARRERRVSVTPVQRGVAVFFKILLIWRWKRKRKFLNRLTGYFNVSLDERVVDVFCYFFHFFFAHFAGCDCGGANANA